MEIKIELNESTIMAISYLKDAHTGDNLKPEEVIQILANDLGMTNDRPGCWEAENMQRVIDSHGWESHLGIRVKK